jgi:GMP synthase (glutamine-hydrolysing)
VTQTRALILHHHPRFGLGAAEAELRSSGMDIRVVDGPGGEMPPRDTAGLACIVALGGPWSALDDDEHPWMRKQLMLLEEALSNGVPVLGLGFGARLLARAAGWRVMPLEYAGRHWLEAGWAPVRRVDAGNVQSGLGLGDCLRALPVAFEAFHFHSETVLPGPGGSAVARSDVDPCQAFVLDGGHAGIQFMLEADEHAVFGVAEEFREFLATCGVAESQLTMDTIRRAHHTGLIASQVFSRFFEAAGE